MNIEGILAGSLATYCIYDYRVLEFACLAQLGHLGQLNDGSFLPDVGHADVNYSAMWRC
jgi:hypothetical protein